MTTHTEPPAKDNERTAKARSMMDQLRALRDATSEPEVRADLEDEMGCLAMSWQAREIFEEDAESAPATGTLKPSAISKSPALPPPTSTEATL